MKVVYKGKKYDSLQLICNLRAVLDGGLPEWTEWLSPASVQECGSEEMNIQRARLWVLGAVQGAAEQAGPAWL